MILSPTREDTLSNMVRSSFQLVKMMVKGGELRVQKYRIIFIIPHYRHRNLLVRQKKSTCTVEFTQYALKGQKLLAQGITLGNYEHKPVALKGQKLYNYGTIIIKILYPFDFPHQNHEPKNP